MQNKSDECTYSSDRRNFLKISGGSLAGAALLSLPAYSRLAQAAAGPDRATIPAHHQRQPMETGWKLVDPPLDTPWTGTVDPRHVHVDYPRPQMTRRHWVNLNGVWQFAATETATPNPGQDLAERILVPFPVESGLSGILRQEPYLTYRRRFVVPHDWHISSGHKHGHGRHERGHGHGAGQRLLLHFDAVDYETRVWVNGHEAGRHQGGYDRFSFDITDHLITNPAGRPHGEQELIVAVHDPSENGGQPLGKQRAANFNNPAGIFYTPASGIWQTVWMEPVPETHIRRLQMTPDVDAGELRLTVEVGGHESVVVEAIARHGRRIVGRTQGESGDELTLAVPNARLWSPDDPFLYDLTVRIHDRHGHGHGRGHGHGHGRPLDEIGSYFGMRKIALETVNGQPHMALNGEFVFEIGPLDQGFWPDGIYTAPTDDALKFDLIKTKALGYNMVRKHIKVEPERWYYYADKLGLLVWQDMPAMRLDPPPSPDDQAQFEVELKQMIDEHRNHPAIVVWVPFNEGWGRFDTARVTDEVKRWDPSRLANQMSGSNVCGCSMDDGDFLDYHNYVGPGPAPQPEDNRASVIGEFGGLGLLEPGHLWTTEGNHAYETEDSEAELTDRYVELLDQTERLIARCGLSAIVYTQTTDVETEINGFFTYDRRVLKLDAKRMREANEAAIAASGKVTRPSQPPPGTPGLVGVGFWALDQGSGTTVPDQSGFGHPATLVNGPTWIAGENQPVLSFDGVNDYVDTGASLLDTTENYSVAAWVWLDDKNGFHTAVSQDGDSHSEFFLQYSDADDRFAFSSASVRALGRNSPATGRWYHLVGVRDAYHSRLKLYVDGSLAGMASYCPGDPANGHT
ncbi:LamG-like jellyroll fold domain-containing protein, partial [Salinisphaera sp.]|uniref:LamG-like jellyroll fold domain-containing protein n=1 Tax=Salinisphaera sp. TaxID=1914330 RepID=UPI002D76669C